MPKKKLTITVEIEELKSETLMLTKHFGEGTLGEIKFEASHTIPTMSLIVEIDKKKYLVSSQAVIEEVVKLHKNQ